MFFCREKTRRHVTCGWPKGEITDATSSSPLWPLRSDIHSRLATKYRRHSVSNVVASRWPRFYPLKQPCSLAGRVVASCWVWESEPEYEPELRHPEHYRLPRPIIRGIYILLSCLPSGLCANVLPPRSSATKPLLDDITPALKRQCRVIRECGSCFFLWLYKAPSYWFQCVSREGGR